MSRVRLTEQVRLERLGTLRPHEQVLTDRLESVAETIRTSGMVDYPILIDDRFQVILDGHHRYQALRGLKGIVRAPVVAVPYRQDELVRLETRTNAPRGSLSKQDVLKMGLSEEVFPPKSTRHVLVESLEPVNVPLDQLRKSDRTMA